MRNIEDLYNDESLIKSLVDKHYEELLRKEEVNLLFDKASSLGVELSNISSQLRNLGYVMEVIPEHTEIHTRLDGVKINHIVPIRIHVVDKRFLGWD